MGAMRGEFGICVYRLPDFPHFQLDALLDEQPWLLVSGVFEQSVDHPP